MALWAALQEEGTCLATIVDDLRWLRSGHEDQWPELGAAFWPAWREIMVQSPWFKRQVAKAAKQDHDGYCQQQRWQLALWAIYRKALQGQRDQQTTLICRPCGRTFRSKGALGAHFHKTHGRCAKDRHVVTGTLCQACGVQYWTTGRLARHLRDIPSCVATLRGHGLTVAVRLPGTGSTSRRKAEQADFHPAAPTRQQQPKEELGSSDWDPTQRAAHAGLCDALLVPDLEPDERHLVGLLRATFGAYPLYVDEAKDVVEFVVAEIGEVSEQLTDEFWTPEVQRAVQRALQTFLLEDWPVPGDAEGPRIEPDTYETLVAASHGFDWAALRTTVAQMHGTRPTSAWTLSDDWEAEWSRNSAEIGPSAVHSRLRAWIPEVLRDAWDSILEGSEVQLSGPPSFWTSPLAGPFDGFRSSLHVNEAVYYH